MKKFELPQNPHTYKNFINGEWKEAHDKRTYIRESPAHGTPVGVYPLSSAADTESAIKAARKSFDQGDWASIAGAERAKIILKVAAGIREQADELALIETLESGKPISQALDEMEWAAGIWDYAATLCRHQYGDANNNLGSDMLAFMYRQPIGVVGMITPWNFPLLIISQKLPFALAAGCTAVVKPSELTPGTTLLLGKILRDAGVPGGVVNILAGFGDPVGKTLTESMEVDMISFTGSTLVGKQIVAASQHNLKKVSLELGGKKQGASLKMGGEVMETPQGVFVQPTVFSEVRPEMDIAKEEIFGPVLSIIRFRDLEEAVKIANSTIYGLSASVWTKDLDTALILSRKIEAGTVWVNNFMTGYPEVSFGGFRQSGLGRELGRFSVEEFSELKSVLIHTGPSSSPWIDPETPSECD